MVHPPSSPTHTQLEPTQDRVSVTEAERLLTEFARSKLAVRNDLVESSEDLSAGRETCYRIVNTELVATEEMREATTSQRHTRSQSFAEQFVDYDLDQRADVVPKEFEAAKFKYLLPDSIQTRSCAACVNGMIKCSRCAGDGRIDCSTCRGSGERPRSEAGENCRSCSGRGTHICDYCTGGLVQCGRCDGDGNVTAYTYLEQTYTPQSETKYITTLDEELLEHAAGRLLRTESALPGESAVKRKIETYEIEATRLNYAVDGEEYQLILVEDEFKYKSYPAVKWKAALPYVAVGVTLLVLVLVVVYAWFL